MTNYHMLQLDAYYNGKLMISKDEKEACTAKLNNCGFRNQSWHMFNADTMSASTQIVNVKGIPFHFPDKRYDKYDAISCQGQVIEFEKGVYSDLYLLGTAFDECGCLEEIHIATKVGEDVIAEVYFNDWYYAKANTTWNYDELNKKECIAGIFGLHLSDLSQRCIYFMHAHINTDSIINEMELPLNPDMFIFAITLGR